MAIAKCNDLKKLCPFHFSKEKHIKLLIKLLSYVLLFLSCYLVYFRPQLQKYMKGGKTFTTTVDEVNHVDMPTMVICAHPDFKPSTRNTFPQVYSSLKDLLEDETDSYLQMNQTIWEAFQTLAYDFSRDFEITHTYFERKGYESNISLMNGLNFNTNFSLSMTNIATARHGMCCLLQPKYFVSENHRFIIQTTRNLQAMDRPESLEMYFVSPNSWHGIVDDDWLHFYPTQKRLNMRDNCIEEWVFKTRSLSELKYMDGFDDLFKCQTRSMVQANCSRLCYPILYNYLNDVLPPCNTSLEANCMIKHLHYNNNSKVSKCLKPKSTIQYDMEAIMETSFKNPSSTVKWTFSFPLTTIEVREEIDVLSIEDMIGYTGGALGLFIGFSCFDYFSKCLDKVFQKCLRKKNGLFLNDRNGNVLKV